MPTFHHPTCDHSCPLSQLSSNVSSQTHMERSVRPCSEFPAYCSRVQPDDLLVCQFLNDREQILLLRALAQIPILKINLNLPFSQLLAFFMYLTSLRVLCSMNNEPYNMLKSFPVVNVSWELTMGQGFARLFMRWDCCGEEKVPR